MMSCILVSLPITPILWRTATEYVGTRFNNVGYVVVALSAIILAMHMICRRSSFDKTRIVFLAGFAGVYLWLLKYQCRFPAERLHLIEYGVFAYLLFRAFRVDFPGGWAYMLSFLASSVFGFFDEILQHVLPNRVFEVRDAVTNLIASGLGLLVVALLVKPDSSSVLPGEAGK